MSRTKHNRPSEKRKRRETADDAPAAKRQEKTRPEQTEYDQNISKMNPSLLADHLAKALKKHSSEDTALELEEKYISSKSIRDTTEFSQPHLAKHLSEYLETFCGGKDQQSKGEIASPHTLIITSSGIRAADLAREVRGFGEGEDKVKVAKLFAKHMKLAECIAFVAKTKINIGVGTPQRPKQLIAEGAMKVDKLKRIVIDGSYVDDKKRTIFDMADVLLPLVEFLNEDKIKSRLAAENDPIELLVF